MSTSLYTGLSRPAAPLEASGSNSSQYKSILVKKTNTGNRSSSVTKGWTKPLTFPTVALSTHVSDRFALELADYCFSFLEDEPYALSKCALVCKIWHYFVDARRYRRSLKLNVHGGNLKLLAVATTPTDSFLRHIRSIAILMPLDVRTEIQQQLWLERFAFSFLARAMRTRDVTLYNMGVQAGESPRHTPLFSTISLGLRGLRHLRELNIACCEFINFHELLTIVCAPQRLRQLSVSEVRITRWEEKRSTSSLKLSSHLRRLRVRGLVAGRLLQWISSPKRSHIPELDTVFMTLREDSLEDHVAAGAFIKLVAGSLRNLEVNLPSARYISLFDLAQNMPLQELSLNNCRIDVDSGENTRDSGALLTLVRQLAGSKVFRRIYMRFVNDPKHILAFPWPTLGEMLVPSTHSFCELKRVEITVGGEGDGKWKLRQHLSPLSSRRMLKLHWKEPLAEEFDF